MKHHTFVDYKLMTSISERVISALNSILCPNGQACIFLAKLHQNARIGALTILGKTIDASKIELYVKKLIQGYIDTLPRRGEAVGIIGAQSTLQPITQQALKSQHSAGKKGSGDDTALIKLNAMEISPRIVSLHLKDTSDSLVRLKRWTKENEYCSFNEVLSSVYGECKYIPSPEREYEELCTFIGVPKTCETFYTFKIDPLKLYEIGVTEWELFCIISTFDCFGLVIHPFDPNDLDTFTFELCPSSTDSTKVISMFNENIQLLLNTRLKGIEGVTGIDIKSIKASDVIKFSNYDSDSNITRLYVAPEVLIYFPLDELSERLNVSFKKSKLSSNEPLHLIVQGEYNTDDLFSEWKPPLVFSEQQELYYCQYHYLSIKGIHISTMMEQKDFHSLFRKDYLLSNDPVEMHDYLGMSVAQSIHENNYYVSLKANKFSLSYSHVQVMCAKMFDGLSFKPLTPSGYEGTEGVNPLDKLSYQNYTKHLSIEPLRVQPKNGFPVKGLIAPVMLGSKPTFGTNLAKYEINEEARRKTIELCSTAKTEQYYQTNERYIGIDFYGVGQVKHVKSGLSRTLLLNESIDYSF